MILTLENVCVVIIQTVSCQMKDPSVIPKSEGVKNVTQNHAHHGLQLAERMAFALVMVLCVAQKTLEIHAFPGSVFVGVKVLHVIQNLSCQNVSMVTPSSN